jgi:2-haloacid dehalogenase
MMFVDRRKFVTLAAGGAAAAAAIAPAANGAQTRIKAIAFDGFPIIDPRPVFAKAEEIFPGKGLELSNAWRRGNSNTPGCEPSAAAMRISGR